MKPTLIELKEQIKHILEVAEQSKQYESKPVNLSKISRFEILNQRMQRVYMLRQQMLQQQNFYKSLQAMHIINVIGFELSKTYQFTAL
jgi:hypothetical protein